MPKTLTSPVATLLRNTIRAYCDKNDYSYARMESDLSSKSGVAHGTVKAALSPYRARNEDHLYNPAIDVCTDIAKAFYVISGDEKFKVKYNRLIEERYQIR